MRLTKYVRKATKELYEKSLTPERLDEKDKLGFFGDFVMNYSGLYGYKFYEQNGEYFCEYEVGDNGD